MRSHTVTAEGGSVAVVQDRDSFEYHFHNTIAGGDWLYERDVVDYSVYHYPTETIQLELWGCPWSRCPDGSVNVCRLDDMKIERTWFVANKTGFHTLHTLFQTSLQFPQIQRFDEHFVLDVLVDDGHVHGLVAMNMIESTLVQIHVNAVVMATGGAGHAYCYNTNGGIVTDDDIGMALSHGVLLRDMELARYHPTGLPGSGILMTKGYRGEGGILVSRDGYRYLQDYGMGLETPLGEPKNKYMELGLYDRISQAFQREWRKGSIIPTPCGDVIYFDLYHLGERRLHEHLSFVYELAKAYVGIDPVKGPAPICLTAHYTAGGIETNQNCETRIKSLFAVGECSSVGLHDANRLDSNSLAGLIVFGRLAGEQATERVATAGNGNETIIEAQAAGAEQRPGNLVDQDGGENWAKIYDEIGSTMGEGCGIYRTPELMQKTIDKLAELQECFRRVHITDTSSVFDTDPLYTIGLGHGLNAAGCTVHSAMARERSRGVYQRLDESCTKCDDVNFLKYIFASRDVDGATHLEYSDVKITTLPPAKYVHSGEADTADKAEVANKKEEANG